MNFKERYILENDAVLLRPLEADDMEYLLEYAVNEPDIWDFNWYGAAGPEGLRTYIDRAVKQLHDEFAYTFIVYDKAAKKYVGSTRFLNFKPDYKTVEIGCTWYGKQYQGTAVNKNCKYLLLEFVFEQLGWERAGFAANNLNERSKNAMKSIGCVEEGVMRNASIDASGSRIDVVILGITKDDWISHVKTLLKNKIDQ